MDTGGGEEPLTVEDKEAAALRFRTCRRVMESLRDEHGYPLGPELVSYQNSRATWVFPKNSRVPVNGLLDLPVPFTLDLARRLVRAHLLLPKPPAPPPSRKDDLYAELAGGNPRLASALLAQPALPEGRISEILNNFAAVYEFPEPERVPSSCLRRGDAWVDFHGGNLLLCA